MPTSVNFLPNSFVIVKLQTHYQRNVKFIFLFLLFLLMYFGVRKVIKRNSGKIMFFFAVFNSRIFSSRFSTCKNSSIYLLLFFCNFSFFSNLIAFCFYFLCYLLLFILILSCFLNLTDVHFL